jgi:hypothetical protein
MSNTDPYKKRGELVCSQRVSRSRFLYNTSHIQLSSIKVCAVIEERKQLRKNKQIYCYLRCEYFAMVNQVVMPTYVNRRYLSSIWFYSICLYIDTRQSCTTSSSELNISIQKNDRKKRKKSKIN